MTKFLRNLILSLLVIAVLAAGLRFYRAANPPYHTVVPIILTANNTILVTATINGVARQMDPDLSWPILAYTPSKQPFEQYQTLVDGKISAATVEIGAYARTCKVTQTDPSGTLFKHGGILGSHVFGSSGHNAAARVTFDLRAKTLAIDWLPTRSLYTPSAHAIVLPLHSNEFEATIDVKLDGCVSAPMCLSLSSPTTYISWEAAKQILQKHDPACLSQLSMAALSPKQIARMTREELMRLSGFHRVKLPVALTMGTRTWKLSCYTVTEGDTANLGMDVLKEFRIIVDYRDRMVYLEPYA